MQHDYQLEKRRFVIGGLVVLILLIYIGRLFQLQVIDDNWEQMSVDNAFYTRIVYPSRGLIYDRNGQLLVDNEPAYDLVVTMRNVKDLDTLDFCQTLGITKDYFIARMKKIRNTRGYSSYTQQTFASQLSGYDYGILQERLYRYKGFEIVPRTVRQYKIPIAPLIMGNIREVSPKEIEKDPYYKRGDYVGDLGVERSYEPYLRGVKGKEILYRDAHGRVQGHYANGAYDQQPVSGRNLTLSIDANLQAYAESLMVNKVGAVVAIEPKTGEVLCAVSAPSFDPRLLVGRQRGKNYSDLYKAPFKPLFDRAVSATYPPGSTFKPTQGLIGLQEGAITPNTPFPCHHGFHLGSFKLGCHGHPSPLPLIPAIATSCNGYFCSTLINILGNRSKYPTIQDAFEKWKNYMVSMGYGYPLGIDIPHEKRGFIPNNQFYNKAFKTEAWKTINIISISIGQGEIMATPLQIANLSATIANRGWFYTPHVVHAIQDTLLPDTFSVKRKTLIDSHWYDYIVQGMRGAVTGGTCRKASLDVKDIEVCGKTGTAQNPHGKDHSVFMGFAPMDDPKIAICVFVEQGGFGATYGVPIGSLVMEKYLTGSIHPSRQYLEDAMLNGNTMQFMDAKNYR